MLARILRVSWSLQTLTMGRMVWFAEGLLQDGVTLARIRRMGLTISLNISSLSSRRCAPWLPRTETTAARPKKEALAACRIEQHLLNKYSNAKARTGADAQRQAELGH